MTTVFDAVIIGAGQAGSAPGRAADQGRNEGRSIERKQLGGTCVNTGCIHFVESTVGHLCQHWRISKVDVEGQTEARRFHQGPGEHVVRHS